MIREFADSDAEPAAALIAAQSPWLWTAGGISVDGEWGIAEHGLKGTTRSFRRRGFAWLAKLAALRWCAAAGFVHVTTGNDASNAAMLGLNDQLGFRPFAIETEWVKQVA